MKNILFIVVLVCVGCDTVVIPKEAESKSIAPTVDATPATHRGCEESTHPVDAQSPMG